MPRLSGRHALLEQLVVQGVKYVFGNPGSTEQAFMDALQDYPQLEYVLALNEAVALGMADGYARASGQPAFVQLHIMPGLGNAMGMLYNSFRSHTPLVVYVGQHPTWGLSQEPILAGDPVRLAQPITKWAAQAHSPAEVPALLRRAFKVAMDPPRGPVLLSVPADLMDQEADAVIAPASGTATRVRPDPEALGRAADLIAGARSPLIICGDGVPVAGAQPEMVQLAETIGARVYSSFAAELPFPSDHPLYAGLLNALSAQGLRGQLMGADLVLAVGTPLLPTLSPLKESPFPPGASVVHIDCDPWELEKDWPVQVSLLGDPKLALADLLSALVERLPAAYREAVQSRVATIAAANQQIFQVLDATARARWDNVPIAPGRLMRELAEALAPGTILFDESVTAGGYVMRYFRFSQPSSHFRATGGGLGPGLPAPIGIQLARPERPVLSLVGDGAALYTIQALWTAAHHRVPVTWVILNNASYRILKLNLLEYRGPKASGRGFLGLDLSDPCLDFAQIAAAFGVKGVRVRRPEEVGDALREAQAAAEPRLIDVVMDGDIRSGWL